MSQTIRLAFSPDSDDIFMFWALLNGKIDTEGLTFESERADTETLNKLAETGDGADVLGLRPNHPERTPSAQPDVLGLRPNHPERMPSAQPDVCAVSVAHYGRISKDYLLLPHGMSVGRGYGPVVVSPKPGVKLGDLEGKKIGVPGLRTTAYLVTRLLLPKFEPVVVPIAPYSAIFDELKKGTVDAGLLIHEGRLFYEREGTSKVVDIGEEWARVTGGLPLPLGGNAIKRSLGQETIAKVSRVCRASIHWAAENADEVTKALLAMETRTDVGLDRASLDKYLDMYANKDTLDAQPDVKQAISELFARGRAAKLLPPEAQPDFAP